MNAPSDESQPTPAEIRVVLAEDHEIVREGIRMVLTSEDGLEVVAEASDVDATERYVLGHKPDVLVLDINLGDESSLERIPALRERSPDTAIVVLTMQNEPAFARQALRAGARGYVIKHSAARELVDAIRTVIRGETYINPQLGARLAAEPPPPEGTPDDLTDREVEVLGLLAQGYMNPEVAERLVISVRTVETHRANIHRKTGITSRAELIAYAVENGMVER
jgi:two-component system, NarL family, response regulator NreC